MLKERYGYWKVIDKNKTYKQNQKILCKCKCGNIRNVFIGNLRSGRSNQCASCSNAKHRMLKTGVYSSWYAMIARCTNKNSKMYKNYGGRGIKVCKRWLKFLNFYKDMGDRPAKHSIERINNNAGYSPKNCIWASNRIQHMNKRNSVECKIMGEKFLLSEVANVTGVDRKTLFYRIKNKGSIFSCGGKNWDEKKIYKKLKALIK